MFHDILKDLYTTYYQLGFYNNSTIASFVKMGLIDSKDYQDITGQSYQTPTVEK